MRSIEHIKKIENFCIDPLSIILGPVIPKPKVEICCLALVFYNENFLVRKKNQGPIHLIRPPSKTPFKAPL